MRRHSGRRGGVGGAGVERGSPFFADVIREPNVMNECVHSVFCGVRQYATRDFYTSGSASSIKGTRATNKNPGLDELVVGTLARRSC